MPIKLRKSHSIRDKATGKMKQEHSYMKMADIKELKELLEMPNMGPKAPCRTRIVCSCRVGSRLSTR